MKRTLIHNLPLIIAAVLLAYTCIGTRGNVAEIRSLGPRFIESRGWRILREEGYQFGSWNHHGGKVWYHVCEIDNPSIRYRVYLSLWDGEISATYNGPEILEHVDVVSK